MPSAGDPLAGQGWSYAWRAEVSKGHRHRAPCAVEGVKLHFIVMLTRMQGGRRFRIIVRQPGLEPFTVR
jgi:hypothetical protein